MVDLDNSRQTEQIGNAVTFYFLIKWRVAAQSRREVDLQEPWTQVLVDEDVEAKHFEAVASFVGHEHVNSVVYYVLDGDDRFDNDVLDL